MEEENKPTQPAQPTQQTPSSIPPKPPEPKNVLFRTTQVPKETAVKKNK